MIEVQQMSTSERLRAMETLWDSLCHDSEELESPVWHGEILADRKRRIESGEARTRRRSRRDGDRTVALRDVREEDVAQVGLRRIVAARRRERADRLIRASIRERRRTRGARSR